ncbi:MAG TPA: phosphatidate cytidylyltransferase [Acidobacteriota bacterium]|jgi:phosphatidate cytidylyltransferase
MSVHAALQSDVFRFYLVITLEALVLAGGVIALLKWGFGAKVDQALRAYRGWLMMMPVLVFSILLGRGTSILFFTIVAMIAFKEFARATGLYRDWLMTAVVYLGIVAAGVISFVSDPHAHVPGWYGLFMALPVYVIAAILIIPIARNRVRGQLQSLALSIVGFIYFGWMFGHLAFLTNAVHAYSYLLFVLFAVELNDVAGYVCGKFFGVHPLRSNISPNKTWEGSLAALAVSMTLPWLLRFTLPDFQPRDCLLAGLIIGVGGQLGDLAVSVIKRDLGIKDMGACIPGHGGILDRVDSLVYTAPLFLHMIRYFHDLY